MTQESDLPGDIGNDQDDFLIDLVGGALIVPDTDDESSTNNVAPEYASIEVDSAARKVETLISTFRRWTPIGKTRTQAFDEAVRRDLYLLAALTPYVTEGHPLRQKVLERLLR